MTSTYQQTISRNLAAAQRALQQLCDSNNADLALTASREMWATAAVFSRLGELPQGTCPPTADIAPLPVQPRPPRRTQRPSRPRRTQPRR